MNEDILKGMLLQARGEIQKEWGKLTQDDITEMNGEVKILKGKLQEKYGHTVEDAEKAIERFLQKLKDL